MPPRIVFTHCAPDVPANTWAVEGHEVQHRPSGFYARGSCAFVAFLPEHIREYAKWFPGLDVRAASLLKHRALDEGGALHLPVTYQSWAVVCDGVRGLGAALAAAHVLRVDTVVCPAPDEADVVHLRPFPGAHYRQWQDRIIKEFKVGPSCR